MSEYWCPDCGKVVERDSHRPEIQSYCSETGRTVELLLVENHPVTEGMTDNKLTIDPWEAKHLIVAYCRDIIKDSEENKLDSRTLHHTLERMRVLTDFIRGM